ncbi:MAG TPA: hypothetical protein VN607_09355 [Gemmatimonadaceae bacterium]|nr:hypothetical protein [Gemmatimonadaceae bacterium]
MRKHDRVTDRRSTDRTGPPCASAAEYQRAVEQELRFRVIRATDAVPGTKTWREANARSVRVPFHTEFEIARSVMDRAVSSGNRETVEHAANELYDMALALVRGMSRIITDGRARVADIDTGRAA